LGIDAGGRWPLRRITIGLPPASMPKQGSGFDLALRHLGRFCL
jgi:magnesium chelatase family protein